MDRTLDIAISFDPPKLDQFEIVQLGQINLLLVSSLKGQTVKAVVPGQYVKVDWGTAFNIVHAQEYASLPVPTLHTSSARIALDFILNNGGCAFLPEHLVQHALRGGELYLVSGANAISRNVYLAYWAENDRLAQIKQAIDFLRDDGSMVVHATV